ncbi:MAG: rod shape-determining protein MreD [Actinobacteria bacterium]|nr:rod shape-determining protein MreD [Actinomycetota bacterium]
MQISFLERLELFGLSFDLVMVTIICISMIDGILYGTFYGFISGLVFDLMLGNIVGVTAFIYAIDGFAASNFVNMGYNKRRILAFVFVTFLITEINLILTSIIRYIFDLNVNLVDIGLELLKRPIFNIALIFLVYPVIRAGSKGEDTFEFGYKEKD